MKLYVLTEYSNDYDTNPTILGIYHNYNSAEKKLEELTKTHEKNRKTPGVYNYCWYDIDEYNSIEEN